MSTNYPTALDTTSNLPPIGATDTEDQAGKEHDVQHSNLNAAVIAIETKLGVNGSAVTTTIDYRVAQLEARPVVGGSGGTIYFA